MTTDVHTPQQRSRNMAAIRSKDTKPEMVVRRLVHSKGYRYRLHRKDLPGKPDLVFPKLKKIIFVHGCFWHLHHCKKGRVYPRTNSGFWKAKRNDNKIRDKKVHRRLKGLGWDILVIWECQIQKTQWLQKKIINFLSN